ncbi:sugar ABC transporter permease [Nitriliruptoraceae bacterium ZYF776]|nr:sugar ABC transporter permease [Profundirhabdus halotolerans]
MTQLATALAAIAVGVGGVLALFWVLNAGVDRLSETWQDRLRPLVFIGPATIVVGLFLLLPAVDTLRRSFLGPDSQEFVGLDNYRYLATDPSVRTAILNNLLWLVIVPAVSVAIGLAVAVLADRLSDRWEKITKSMIFLPMAISFVGAGTIWGFIYAWRAPDTPQIGLLNAVWTSFGGEPVGWLQNFAINDFALMVIMIWLQAGFAMVLLSAAIKNVPTDTIEAAKVDGATEFEIFWRVTVPQIRSTIVVVTTTILILVLKIFDIVYVMTNGNYGTDVIANLFIREMFNFGQFGRAAVLVVFLIVVTVPFMVLNIRRFREQEAMR